MPMPKPTRPEDLRINGRVPKTLDVQIVKLFKTDSTVPMRMAKLAAAKKAADAKAAEE